ERRFLTSGATGACGAGIRQQWSTKENTKLAIDSVKHFVKFSRELGMDIDFRQGGYLIINHDEKEVEQSKKNIKMQRSLGLDVRFIDRDEINDIVPILDVEGMHAIGATFCPTDGHANPFKTTFALAKAARRYGANIMTHTTLTDIVVENHRVKKVKTTNGSIETDVVVNAAGAWSKKIAEMVGIDIPNTPFRKEIMVTERLKLMFEAMVISFKDGIYFSQQKEGHILGGLPIPEEREGYNFMPTFMFLTHMAKTLTRYVPSLKYINMVRHWTGFYDVTPDARPILGESEEVKGFIHCHGFSGHGFMLSPKVSEVLAEYIADDKKDEILDSLSLKRFKTGKFTREKSVVG
ncbi:MAG TPA: FAD-binding oxidoreductase, partial [Thermoplasmatales archaeon]|nr:FAD-binding oxidoreductase [Thermoplasmatales archaeon]